MLRRSSIAILVVATSMMIGADARSAAAPVTQDTIDAVVAKLKALRPDLQVEGATAAQIPGMITIELTGGALLYTTADGRYLIAGVSVKDMAVFPAKGARKAVITVFTDVDCSYCRKLHLEVPRMNQMGVEVRYLAYPRTGLDSPGYAKMVTAWCSSNRGDAITRMKRGEELPPKTCNNPVAKEYEIGHLVGLTGTPAIVLEDGRMIAGYVSADELGEVLGI